MATGWTCLIGGVDYSARTQFSTVSISRSNRHLGSTCSLEIELTSKSLPRPKGFQQIIIARNSDGARLFGGIIHRVEQHEAARPAYTYRILAADYTRWLDHIPCGAQVYPKNPTDHVDDIVREILQDWVTPTTPNTTLGDPLGPSVPITFANDTQGVPASSIQVLSFQPTFQPVSQAIDQLAKMVNAVWFVDEYARLWFLMPDTIGLISTSSPAAAPLLYTQINFYNQDLAGGSSPVGPQAVALPTLDADNALANIPLNQANVNTTYDTLVLSEDTSTVISGVTAQDFLLATNTQASETSANNGKLVGDGFSHTFTLYNMPIDPAHTTVTKTHSGVTTTYTASAGNLKTEYVDGRPETPTKDQSGNLLDWVFVCQSNQGVRFNVAPANGDTITVTYNYYQPHSQDVLKNLELANEIARREGFGPGMYYQIISGDQLALSPVTLGDGTPGWLAQELIALNRYGRINLEAQFNSRLWGWRPGQLFALTSKDRGDSFDAPTFNIWGQTFVQRMYVTSTETKIINDTEIKTAVVASTSIWGA